MQRLSELDSPDLSLVSMVFDTLYYVLDCKLIELFHLPSSLTHQISYPSRQTTVRSLSALPRYSSVETPIRQSSQTSSTTRPSFIASIIHYRFCCQPRSRSKGRPIWRDAD